MIRQLHPFLARSIAEHNWTLDCAAIIRVGGGYGEVGSLALIAWAGRAGHWVDQLRSAFYHILRALYLPEVGGAFAVLRAERDDPAGILDQNTDVATHGKP